MTDHTAAIPTMRPFHCGTEFADWENDNCAACRRSGQDDEGEYHWGSCEMEDALTLACVGDGQWSKCLSIVPELLAIAHGWGNDPGYWTAPHRCEKWLAP